MKYMGMQFKNYDEFNEWCKKGHIEHYKMLVKLFNNHANMERLHAISQQEDFLMKKFGMTSDEIEEIQISVFAS